MMDVFADLHLLPAGDWMDRAGCRDVPAEWFFPNAQQTTLKQAREVCSRCPVREACLRMAMEAEKGLAKQWRYGIYAGLTPRERALLDDDLVPKCKKAGHPMSEENTRIDAQGAKRCRACDRIRKGCSEVKIPPATHCVNDHEYTPENTGRTARGHRRCKTCDREQTAARRLAARQEQERAA